MTKALVDVFAKNYKAKPTDGSLRKIGIELELPIVTDTGEAVSYATIRKMFKWFSKNGWELTRDEGTQEVVAAEKSISTGKGRFGYETDTIGPAFIPEDFTNIQPFFINFSFPHRRIGSHRA